MNAPEKLKCPDCMGDGWTVKHHPNCSGWRGEGCDCSGFQVDCVRCQGKGEI
jgi:hypothetical protein